MGELRSFDGVTLHYEEEAEDPSGPPVVLLHGFTSSTEGNWRGPGIIKALLAARFRVIGLDARGHGRSDKPHDPAAYEDDAMVKDVAALFDHLGLDRADVVGYSMGSGTASRFAQQDHRVRRLVLGGAGSRLLGLDARGQAEAAERARLRAAALEADDPERIEDAGARAMRRYAEASGADLKALAALQRARRRWSELDPSAVTAPTLVICGDRDVSPHELATALPAGQAKVIAGDHWSAVANPALAAEIVAFLSA